MLIWEAAQSYNWLPLQQRNEHRRQFLEPDVKAMTIDDAMSALLEVSGEQFKKNVELYGAVHTDELRYVVFILTSRTEL